MNHVRTGLAVVLFGLGAAAGSANPQQGEQQRSPPQPLHQLAGKQECLSCHGRGANERITSIPADHRFQNAMCPACHVPVETAPPRIPHPVGPRFPSCDMCHMPNSLANAPAPPASHRGFHASICRLCHEATVQQPTPGS